MGRAHTQDPARLQRGERIIMAAIHAGISTLNEIPEATGMRYVACRQFLALLKMRGAIVQRGRGRYAILVEATGTKSGTAFPPSAIPRPTDAQLRGGHARVAKCGRVAV